MIEDFPLAYEAEDCFYAVVTCKKKKEPLMKQMRAILYGLPSRTGVRQQMIYTFPDGSWLEVWWPLEKAIGHPKSEVKIVQCYRIEYSPGVYSEEAFATQNEAKRFMEKICIQQ